MFSRSGQTGRFLLSLDRSSNREPPLNSGVEHSRILSLLRIGCEGTTGVEAPKQLRVIWQTSLWCLPVPPTQEWLNWRWGRAAHRPQGTSSRLRYCVPLGSQKETCYDRPCGLGHFEVWTRSGMRLTSCDTEWRGGRRRIVKIPGISHQARCAAAASKGNDGKVDARPWQECLSRC